jgi:hypothetical protein
MKLQMIILKFSKTYSNNNSYIFDISDLTYGLIRNFCILLKTTFIPNIKSTNAPIIASDLFTYDILVEIKP